jgi:hypothetical protein
LPKARIGDRFTDVATGNFDPAKLPDCNIYNTKSVWAHIFGPAVNVARVLPRLLARISHRK